MIVVARGGGSLADLFAFCDETLCRTVALLRVPVIASVGHHADRTLIDDVAAVACSTPTHAAETAVPLHCGEARAGLARRRRARAPRRPRRPPPRRADGQRRRLARHARRAVVARARARRALARARRARRPPAPRAAPDAARAARERDAAARATSAPATAGAPRRSSAARRPPPGRTPPRAAARSTSLALALAAHDPERVVERGYAVVDDRAGNVITSAEAARAAGRVRLFFADAAVDATITEDEE